MLINGVSVVRMIDIEIPKVWSLVNDGTASAESPAERSQSENAGIGVSVGRKIPKLRSLRSDDYQATTAPLSSQKPSNNIL